MLDLHTTQGGVTGDNFVQFMEHFVKRSGFKKDKPMLILVDSGQSHLDIKVLYFAKVWSGDVISTSYLSHIATLRQVSLWTL